MIWIDPLPPATAPSLSDLHPIVAETLARRGFTTPEAVRAFLDPAAYSPAPASDLPGLSAALYRIERARLAHEPVCVWGDFDTDGQTSTTVLVQTLRALDIDVTYHIPVRAAEGHGVNLPHLKEIIAQGARLVLTCDTGISALEAVEYARTHSVDVIITDHHDLPETIPQAAAVINPKLLPPDHPLATLAGVGVAYKLAEALITHFRPPTLSPEDLLDLVALGLVADLALLRRDTRYLVQKGLTALRTTPRVGLQAIFEKSELDPLNLTEEHISFTIAPRLNALGRLGDANSSVELLTTSDPARARLLALQLENYNAQRQLLCAQVTQAAEARLRADPSLLTHPVIILAHPAWPGGVVGIVASHLVERYSKPAILFSTPAGSPAHGSARSVEGFNITAAIADQKDLLLGFGGHPMAAGLALDPENLPEFQRRLFATAGKMLGTAAPAESELPIDAWLALPELTLDLAAALETLSPYGPGNEKLIMASHDLTLRSSAAIGRNKEHLKLEVADEAGNAETVLYWNGAGENLPDGKFDLAYTLRASDWRGKRQVQVEFVDFRPVADASIEIKTAREVIDERRNPDPGRLLSELGAQPSVLVWAEAEAKKETGGVDRNGLTPADILVIWSIPPSPAELHAALEITSPDRVYLIGAHPPREDTDNFMSRLIGLLKFAINQRAGKVSYSELAAATGQRQVTVELGLNYLVSRGNVSLKRQENDQLWITPGTTINDLGGAARLLTEVQSLLAETAAYRAHFRNADKDTLLY